MTRNPTKKFRATGGGGDLGNESGGRVSYERSLRPRNGELPIAADMALPPRSARFGAGAGKRMPPPKRAREPSPESRVIPSADDHSRILRDSPSNRGSVETTRRVVSRRGRRIAEDVPSRRRRSNGTSLQLTVSDRVANPDSFNRTRCHFLTRLTSTGTSTSFERRCASGASEGNSVAA